YQSCVALCCSTFLSFESCQIMPDSTVVTFNGESFCLCLQMFFRWNKGFITFPIIRTMEGYGNIPYCFPKPEFCLGRTVSADKRDKPLSRSVNSYPDPTAVFLNPHMYASHQAPYIQHFLYSLANPLEIPIS
ncbi:hypothetical protein EZS27_036698, partial [termite gut metagenome]